MVRVRVAIPCSDESGLNSTVSQHFGRARYFLIAEIGDEISTKVVELPFVNHMPGDIPRFLQSLGVDTVIVYGLGMKARSFFENMGITVISGAMGRVGEVLERFIRGNLVLDLEWERKEEFRRHGHCD
ncbi:dinitrogenase iron-molybdenum cofactor [Archaeoglobales archaeon]|nr:MAG: dinitrogenase iron-molybdenum cofactor [Archaeoglobales archaeon]